MQGILLFFNSETRPSRIHNPLDRFKVGRSGAGWSRGGGSGVGGEQGGGWDKTTA